MPTARNPTLIAHRGAASEAPENTISAIRKAIDIGVDYIELDVRLTKDSVPVIIHDPTLLRTTAVHDARYVHDLTIEQIKQCDVGSWFDSRFAGETIPTLEDVLRLTANKTPLMIEIKAGQQSPQIIVGSILRALKNAAVEIDLLKFGSFSAAIMQEIITCAPDLDVMGIAEKTAKIPDFLRLGIRHMAVWYPLINADIVDMLHNQNIDIWSFTVDDPELVSLLASLSVEGIITNKPRQIKEGFEQQREKI